MMAVLLVILGIVVVVIVVSVVSVAVGNGVTVVVVVIAAAVVVVGGGGGGCVMLERVGVCGTVGLVWVSLLMVDKALLSSVLADISSFTTTLTLVSVFGTRPEPGIGPLTLIGLCGAGLLTAIGTAMFTQGPILGGEGAMLAYASPLALFARAGVGWGGRAGASFCDGGGGMPGAATITGGVT